jgi:hypothetical protein
VNRVLLALALVFASSCKDCGKGPIGPAVNVVIDCLMQDQGKIGSLSAELLPLISGASPDWATFQSKAEAAGISIGGCVAAALIQKYLAPPPGNAAPSPEAGQAARATMESLRKKFNGATFTTDQGVL